MLDVGAATAFPRMESQAPKPAVSITIAKRDFGGLLTGNVTLDDLRKDGRVSVEGDGDKLTGFLANLDGPVFWFNVVEP